jgi:UDP-2,3-diacylglucosamine hydrolase
MTSAAPPTPTTQLGLIAGSGQFPIWVAKAACAQGLAVHVVALQGWADPAIEHTATSCTWIRLGELKKLLQAFNVQGITTATVAGKVTKEAVLKSWSSLDPEMIKVIAHSAGDMRVNSLLGALAQRLEREHITLVDATQYLQQWLPDPGTLSRREPTAVEWSDIRLGQSVATVLAGYDVGQTVVVQRSVVLAVEASEATNATIARAREYSEGPMVVIKVARPNQDMRFDVPVVGPDTVDVLRASHVSCLAVEARKTLLLERAHVLRAMDEADIAVVAL